MKVGKYVLQSNLGVKQVEIFDIYVGSYFSISKYPAAKVVLTVW